MFGLCFNLIINYVKKHLIIILTIILYYEIDASHLHSILFAGLGILFIEKLL